MKKSVFMLLFVSVLFISAAANAATISKIEKKALMQPTESNVKAYIKTVHVVNGKSRIIGLYAVNANTAKIKAVRNIIALLKKHGYENNNVLFKETMKKRIEITKRVGDPIVIGIPEKKIKSKYKAGLINKNVLIANESVSIKPKAIALIHLLMKNGYNVGIGVTSPKRDKVWFLTNLSYPFITIVP